MREYKQFYINGEWVEPTSPNNFDVLNPATEEVCATISLGNETDVDKAVAAAKAAFETFSQTSVEERIALLERIAGLLTWLKRSDLKWARLLAWLQPLKRMQV